MRFLTPALLLCAAAYVAWEATNGSAQVIAFGFLRSLLPDGLRTPQGEGLASAGLLALVGAWTLARAVRDTLRSRQSNEEA